MDKLYNDLVPEDRLTQIKAEAIRQETMQFEKPLSDDELIELKDEQNILSLRLFRLEKKKKKFMEQHKNEKKPVEIKQKEVLTAMDTRTISVEGDVFLVPDHDKKMMYYVDGEGNIIQARALLQDERQMHIIDPSVILNKAFNG
jgi:hypothetical protein